MSRLSPGQMVAGKLRVLELLGSGAMGTVYAVEHLTLRNRQALKVLNADLARRPEQVERFLREGVAISRVRHRAVVQVFDAGLDQGMPWIAMELLEGETLKSRIRRGGMPASESVRIAIEVLGGLAASHEQGIVHRDLKPTNIFLARQPDGTVQPKILDFGVALLLDVNERITAVGTTMGSIQYMAPEQIHASRDVDARADIYAVGAILYEALSGRTPYRATTVPELLTELAYTPPPDLRMAAPHQPQWLAELVNQCLARERERRPTDARTLLAALASREASVHSQPGARMPAGTLVMQGVSADPLGPTAPVPPNAHKPASYPAMSQPGSYPGHHSPAPGWGPQPSPAPYGSQPGSWPGSHPGSHPAVHASPSAPQWQGSDPALLFAQPKPSPLRHLLWIAPLLGLLMVGGAFGVWSVIDDEDDGPPVAQQSLAPTIPAPPQPLVPDPGPAMLPIEPRSDPPPVVPQPSFPALAPTPVQVEDRHPCVGRWRGSLHQSDGQRAGGSVNIEGTGGSCGGFVERWDSGSVCHYRLYGCSARDNVITSSASTPAHEQCTPVRMRFTCERGQLRFFEDAQGVTVTSVMSRIERD